MNENKTFAEEVNDMGFTVIDLGTDRLSTGGKWNIEEETGYKPLTTFWEDFSRVEKNGPIAVIDATIKTFAGCCKDVRRLTELALVLNHKCWQHYHEKRPALSGTYSDLWEGLHDFCLEHLHGEDLDYYLEITD